MKYEPVIGLEIHAELSTQSKLFCACKNDPFGASAPNISVCPICVGLPGTLPVMNRAAVESTVLVGLALGCRIGWLAPAMSLEPSAISFSKFDRKNYFYPDLPKAYQISQYDLPICHEGKLEIGLDGHAIAVTRIHLEEDTAKLIHPAGSKTSLVDFNRAGVPLLELVTEPEIRGGGEAADFAKYYQLVLRTLNVADADMEKGGMRVEVNISLRKNPKTEQSKLGTKVEIKNLNSFKVVQQAIDYEIERQAALLEAGEPVIQETRGWDEMRRVTVSQRVKETAADYRYFPEPDLPPVTFGESDGKTQTPGIDLKELRVQVPELPLQIWNRWVREWSIPDHVAWRITADPQMSRIVDQALKILSDMPALPEARRRISGRKVADWVMNGLADRKIPIEQLAKLGILVAEGTLTHETAKSILEEFRSTGRNVAAIIETQAEGAENIDLEATIETILAKFPRAIRDHQTGKPAAFGYLMGQVIQATHGRVDPALVKSALEKKLTL